LLAETQFDRRALQHFELGNCAINIRIELFRKAKQPPSLACVN